MKRKLNQEELARLEQITRIVMGAIKDTINAHGPITQDFVPSATKRIANQIFVTMEEKKAGQPQPVGDPLEA